MGWGEEGLLPTDQPMVFLREKGVGRRGEAGEGDGRGREGKGRKDGLSC